VQSERRRAGRWAITRRVAVLRLIRLKDTWLGGHGQEPPARPGEAKPAAESQSIGAARPREATRHRRSAVLPFAARGPYLGGGGRSMTNDRMTNEDEKPKEMLPRPEPFHAIRHSSFRHSSFHAPVFSPSVLPPSRLDSGRSGRKRRDESGGGGRCLFFAPPPIRPGFLRLASGSSRRGGGLFGISSGFDRCPFSVPEPAAAPTQNPRRPLQKYPSVG